MLRKCEKQRSVSCVSQQPPSIDCSLRSDLSNMSPWQHRTAVVCNKQLSIQSANQDAEPTPHSPSPALHIPVPSLSTSHDSAPPLPQSSPAPVVTDAAVNAQQVAEVMVRFILASDNPELKAALKRILESDPSIVRRL